jgi:hypothetical protein
MLKLRRYQSLSVDAHQRPSFGDSLAPETPPILSHADAWRIPPPNHVKEIAKSEGRDDLHHVIGSEPNGHADGCLGPRGDGGLNRPQRLRRLAKVRLEPEMYTRLVLCIPRDVELLSQLQLHVRFMLLGQVGAVEEGKIYVLAVERSATSMEFVPNQVANDPRSNNPFWRVDGLRRLEDGHQVSVASHNALEPIAKVVA